MPRGLGARRRSARLDCPCQSEVAQRAQATSAEQNELVSPLTLHTVEGVSQPRSNLPGRRAADPERLLTRRNFLLGAGGVVGAAAAGITYMRLAEPEWLELTRTQVSLPGRVRSPLRIAHLSDFHASPQVSYSFIAHAVETAIQTKPDLVLLTGDYFTDRLDQPDAFARILRRLSQAAPTFGCLGNHDGGPWTELSGGYRSTLQAEELLRGAGITCLENAAARMTLKDTPIEIIGVGDWWSNRCEPRVAFSRASASGQSLRLVLNHNPDAKEGLRDHAWDVMFCGHTHGGQCRLPLLGTPFAPVVDRRFVAGLHRWENRWIYITRGVGNLHGVRFNCRPEVSIVELS